MGNMQILGWAGFAAIGLGVVVLNILVWKRERRMTDEARKSFRKRVSAELRIW
jgi:Na+/proline symporter